jgi:hypothetical protein
MSSTPEPQLLAAAPPVNNGTTFSIRLSWVNPVKYDKLQVAWGVGTLPTSPSPSSAELDPALQSYTIAGFSPSTTVVLKVQGAVHGDLLLGQNPADLYWSGWAAVNVVVPHSLNEVLLLYKRTTGNVFTAPITAGTQIGALTQIGTWDNNWTQLSSFVVGGTPFLLLYKQSDGSVWTAPVTSGANRSGDTNWNVGQRLGPNHFFRHRRNRRTTVSSALQAIYRRCVHRTHYFRSWHWPAYTNWNVGEGLVATDLIRG